MDVAVIRTGSTAMVKVAGDIDADTAPRLEECFNQVIREGVTDLTVDPEHVSFVSSAGLTVLISAHRSVSTFQLQRGNAVVDRLIDLTGLETLYGLGD